jgi:hypothetical protein
MITKNDDMLALSERLLQLANDEGTAQIHDVAIKIAALASRPAQSTPVKPVAWLVNSKFGTEVFLYEHKANATAKVQDGNVRPLYVAPPAEGSAPTKAEQTTAFIDEHGRLKFADRLDAAEGPKASDGDLTQGVRWQIVNDEPFEYAIQLGPHGDEFVKLLNGECLRRPISRTPAEGDGLHRLTDKQTEAVWGLTIDEAARKIEKLESDLAAAKEEAESLQATFDLQWEADQRAIKRWQAAHPGNDLVRPDRANMVVWLMEEHAKDAGDAATLRGFVKTFGMMPSMMASERDSWKRRAESRSRFNDARRNKIEELRQALFPDETEKEIDGHKVTVNHDAAINLQGALYDLKRLHSKNLPPDEPCINTIERVTEQLSKARAALRCEQCSAVPPAAHHPDCVHYCDPAWRSPAAPAQGSPPSDLLEELDIYIRSAEKYERGDADFAKNPSAGFMKKIRTALQSWPPAESEWLPIGTKPPGMNVEERGIYTDDGGGLFYFKPTHWRLLPSTSRRSDPDAGLPTADDVRGIRATPPQIHQEGK